MLTAPPARRTGFVWDERYCWHDATIDHGRWVEPGASFENPTGKRRIAALVAASGLGDALHHVAPVTVSPEDAARVHTPAYLDLVERLSAGDGGDVGDECHVGRGSWEVARLAAGGTFAAVAAVLRGEVDNAYALVRPAGHHAEAARGRGYCVLGNIPVALLKARAELGLGRVAVVDWDVHHGNGTQDAFWDDASVLTVSLHQDRLYPEDSGTTAETGGTGAPGSVVNVPLPAGCGWGAYADALERVVLPAVRAHEPELVVVASGFDGGGLDPLGRMMLSSNGFRRLTRAVLDVADEVCGGRVVMSHEGGYNELHSPFCGLAVLEELSGAATDVDDPFAWLDDDPHQALAPHQSDAVGTALTAWSAARGEGREGREG